jgi:hypothetical protein
MSDEEDEYVRSLTRAHPAVVAEILREEGYIVTPPPEPDLPMGDFDPPNLTDSSSLNTCALTRIYRSPGEA